MTVRAPRDFCEYSGGMRAAAASSGLDVRFAADCTLRLPSRRCAPPTFLLLLLDSPEADKKAIRSFLPSINSRLRRRNWRLLKFAGEIWESCARLGIPLRSKRW
jgi:hypothetical protein